MHLSSSMPLDFAASATANYKTLLGDYAFGRVASDHIAMEDEEEDVYEGYDEVSKALSTIMQMDAGGASDDMLSRRLTRVSVVFFSTRRAVYQFDFFLYLFSQNYCVYNCRRDVRCRLCDRSPSPVRAAERYEDEEDYS